MRSSVSGSILPSRLTVTGAPGRMNISEAVQRQRALEQLHQRFFIAHLRDGDRGQAISVHPASSSKGHSVVCLQPAAQEGVAIGVCQGEKLDIGAEEARFAHGGAVGKCLPHLRAKLSKTSCA